MTSKLVREQVKTRSKMHHWLNVLILDKKRFLNFFTSQPSAKNDFRKNLTFHDFTMTQTNFSNFHYFPGLECKFQIPWLSVTFPWPFHERVNPTFPCRITRKKVDCGLWKLDFMTGGPENNVTILKAPWVLNSLFCLHSLYFPAFIIFVDLL